MVIILFHFDSEIHTHEDEFSIDPFLEIKSETDDISAVDDAIEEDDLMR